MKTFVALFPLLVAVAVNADHSNGGGGGGFFAQPSASTFSSGNTYSKPQPVVTKTTYIKPAPAPPAPVYQSSSSSSSSYSQPKPQQPKYQPKYQPQPPQPKYQPQPQPQYQPQPQPSYTPTKNCTVIDEVLRAEICTPEVEVRCKDEEIETNVVTEEDFCFTVPTVECRQEEDSVDTEICTYSYNSEQLQAEATTVDVTFEKRCQKQMVTICEHGGGYGHNGYGGYQSSYGPKCEEVAQETCYNTPNAHTGQKQLNLVVPKAEKQCQTRTIKVPKVSCDTKEDERCVKVPKVVPDVVTVQKCDADIGSPKCREVELVLPKQICKDVVIGYAKAVSAPPKQPPRYHG